MLFRPQQVQEAEGKKLAEDFGAEIRYVGKPQWLALEDGEPNPAKPADWHPCVLMIVRPNEKL